MACAAGIGLAHAGPTERRIRIERIGCTPFRHLMSCIVQKVFGNDFVIVVARMGEGAATITIAERPDAWDIWINRRSYDDYQYLLPIECKRLPTPEGKDRDLRE